MEKQTQVTQRVSTEVCVMQELGSGTPYSGEMSYIIFLHYTVDFHWRLSQRITSLSKLTTMVFSQHVHKSQKQMVRCFTRKIAR